MIKIIAKNAASNRSAMKLLTPQTHKVSSAPVFMPTVNTANRAIYATSSEPQPLTNAVKNFITLTFDSNGSLVNPLNEVIPLGAQYDNFVSIWHFDLTQLLWKKSDETNFLFRLSFLNPDTQIDIANGLIVDAASGVSSLTDLIDMAPLTYEFDGEDFFVPRELTAVAGKYKVILIIQELINDEDEGNVVAAKEIFISDAWMANVTANFYTPEVDLATAVEPLTEVKSLIKAPLKAYLADDGTFAISALTLGNRFDAFMRGITFTNMTYHLYGFTNYLLFRNDGTGKIAVAKFGIGGTALIPSEVTSAAGIYSIMVVSKNEDDYCFCSTVIKKLKVVDNFLSGDAFNTNEGAADNIRSAQYSNFLAADGKIITTSDKQTFFWNEQ